MSRKDKGPKAEHRAQAPVEQVIEGRLAGSDTELEQTFDARHDISNIDCQEGHMNHGTKGGCFDEEKEGFSPA